MPQTLKETTLVHLKKAQKNILRKNKINQKYRHVEIRITRRMIILYLLSSSQRKYNNSDM